jgi:hypothetical protein
MTGSKRVNHWTSGTVCVCSEISGSPKGSPQEPTMSVVKPEGGPAASVKLGQKSCERSSGIITLSGRRPSDSSRTKPASDEATTINHVEVTNVARQC